ncbi:SRPBCC family protein [Seonamhaeicola maritimus]|uniref:SRPBCC family protein n=1 Tax=Seonamhaeicola maritimus TaxID=2591822 RepID=UPI002494A973|nr:SRPBCC family protein [Seonamhaeicola maritimus]
MKFTCSININKPKLDVVKHFEDPEALKQSQKGFQRIDHLSGNKKEAGAKSKLFYAKFEMIETIIENKLPDTFEAQYDHKNMSNTMHTEFVAINDHETKLTTIIEYTRFTGFIINVMARLFPSMFRKQVDKWLVKFKYYVEKQ